MTPKEAKRLVGRTIVAVDMRGRWEDDGPGTHRVYCHDPIVTLDDGSVLTFHAEELPHGDGYGIDIKRSRRASKPTD